ncbi:MAG TPA: hypothetical protein VFJ43_15150 [Bacteroidia bacterium]|nr:hypothetical protein [Bacteroidia bacterium]
MNPLYSIQKPCTEDWGKMTHEEQGRHCQVCCKTVVDFSQKSNTEIIGFLKSNSGNKICGRFRAEQLHLSPQSRVPSPAKRYRTFFAALLFVFGGLLFSSCNQHRPEEVMGDVAYTPDSTQKIIDTVKQKFPVVDTTKKTGSIQKPKCKKPKVVEEEHYMMGDVAYDPKDTIR